MAIPAASVPQERIAAVRHFNRSRPHFPASEATGSQRGSFQSSVEGRGPCGGDIFKFGNSSARAF